MDDGVGWSVLGGRSAALAQTEMSRELSGTLLFGTSIHSAWWKNRNEYSLDLLCSATSWSKTDPVDDLLICTEAELELVLRETSQQTLDGESHIRAYCALSLDFSSSAIISSTFSVAIYFCFIYSAFLVFFALGISDS